MEEKGVRGGREKALREERAEGAARGYAIITAAGAPPVGTVSLRPPPLPRVFSHHPPTSRFPKAILPSPVSVWFPFMAPVSLFLPM